MPQGPNCVSISAPTDRFARTSVLAYPNICRYSDPMFNLLICGTLIAKAL